MADRIKAKKVGKTVVFKAQPQSDPLTTVIDQNKVVDGIYVRIRQGETIAEIPLSRFLQKFETPKQRASVQTAVHATLRMNGKTEQQIAAKRAELMKDERSRAAYWNCDDFGSISGVRDAENWVEGELEKCYERYLAVHNNRARLSRNKEAVCQRTPQSLPKECVRRTPFTNSARKASVPVAFWNKR